jgi:hypothetical protein
LEWQGLHGLKKQIIFSRTFYFRLKNNIFRATPAPADSIRLQKLASQKIGYSKPAEAQVVGLMSLVMLRGIDENWQAFNIKIEEGSNKAPLPGGTLAYYKPFWNLSNLQVLFIV